MTWEKATLGLNNMEMAPAITGECKHCHQCCACWIYDQPDQPGDVPPKRGWCPELDLNTKTCRVWDARPEGCHNFPTERDFELGAVPDGCGYKLIK